MKRIIVLCILFLCVNGICLGQTNNTRSVSVTTYYPSPTAVYSNLRLSPADTAPSGTALQPGVIYYNNTTGKINYFNKTLVPVELPGSAGGGPDYWQVTNNTTAAVMNNTETTGAIIIGENSTGPDKLQVNGITRLCGEDDNAILYVNRWSNVYKSQVVFNVNDPDTDKYSIGIKGGPSHFFIGNGTEEFVTLNKAGNVGIGVSNASCRLQIAGDKSGANISQSLMMVEGDGEQGIIMVTASNMPEQGPELRAYRSRGSLGANLLEPKENDTLFTMAGWGWAGSTAKWKNGGFIQFSADGDFNNTSTPGRISFHTTPIGSTVPLERMVITSEGNFGINEPDPQYKMVVRINATAYAYFNSTGGWTGSSDKRLKKNISGIEDALAKVLRVKGIRYDPIDDTSSVPPKGKYFGFAAQDLEPIFPELVSTNRKGRKSVVYGSITPVLVEAIKAQHEEIEALRKEIKAIKELK